MPQPIYSQIDSNKNKTWLIMLLFVVFISAVGYVFAQVLGYGLDFVGVMLIISGLLSLGSYYFSDSMILAISSAKEISDKSEPALFHSIENLCIASGLPRPKIYLIEDSAPNAFATGRDPKHAVICVTRGLLDKLDKLELEGVIAHELSHVKNYDTRLMAVVTILVGMIALLADYFMRSMWFGGRSRSRSRESGNSGGILILIGFALAILSPIIAKLMQLTLSRQREFLADASGALITRYPKGLAQALRKISADQGPLEAANNATAHLYIANPFKNIDHKMAGLFDTHPPIEERIRILEAM